MSKLDTALSLLTQNRKQFPYAIFRNLTHRGLTKWIPDKPYLQIAFRLSMGKKLHLDNPKSFNEKLQWLKLYDHKPEYITFVDKYRVREYISETIGEEYLIPLLGKWDSFNEINVDELPNQFVLKCNHDSGSVIVCRDKSKLNFDEARKKLESALKGNGYWFCREWPYKDIKPCIIAEQYMEGEFHTNSNVTGLLDYKFYCFNGEPRFLYVGYADIIDGVKHDRLTYFDLEWHKTAFKRPDHEELPFHIEKPTNFDEMIAVSKRLSENIPFVRVDLYSINNHVYFSEMTFFPGAGLAPFYPEEWEYMLGSWITLPTSNEDN